MKDNILKKVIITGASGFIGKALSVKMSSCGIQVWAIVRDKTKVSDLEQDNNIKIIEAGYENYEKLDMLIDEREFDAFFHMAWEFRGDSLYDEGVQLKNIEGACSAAKVAKKLNCNRFVFMTSFFEYKKDFFILADNKSVSDDSSVYGKCKKCASELTKIICIHNKMEHISIMLSNIFGRGDYSKRAINTMIINMIKGNDVPVVEGNCLYDYIYIDDAVDGIKVIAEKGNSNEEYYLGNNALRPFREFVLDMKKAVNPNANLQFGAFPDTSYIDFQRIDLYKVYRDTGFLPKCKAYDSFKKTEEWLREIES